MGSGEGWIVAATVAVLALFVFGMMWLSRSATRRLMAPLAARFSFEHPQGARGAPEWERLEGDWRGQSADITFVPGSRHELSHIRYRLRMSSSLPIRGRLRARRKHLLDRLAVRIGLAKRLWKPVYGAPGRVFVEADDDEQAAALLRNDTFRQALVALVEPRWSTVELTSDAVSLTIRAVSGRRRRLLQPAYADRTLTRLADAVALDVPEVASADATLAAPVPTGEPGHAIQDLRAILAGSPVAGLLKAMTVSAAALVLLGPIMLWWGTWFPPLSWELHWLGFFAGGVVSVLYAAMLFTAVRGRSRALRDFATWTSLAVIGYPCFFAGALVVGNGLADTGPVRVLHGEVVRIEDDRVMGIPERKLVVALPLDDGRSARVGVRVSRERVRQATVGETAAVQIRPGAAGHAWAAGVPPVRN